MSQTDFIPRPDAAFDRYFRAMSQYVNTKTTGTSPAWTHIPSPERLAFNEQYANWYNAYALTFNPHSPDITRRNISCYLLGVFYDTGNPLIIPKGSS
jgi:hypothetical protein